MAEITIPTGNDFEVSGAPTTDLKTGENPAALGHRKRDDAHEHAAVHEWSAELGSDRSGPGCRRATR
jgi:hypothetical protein